MSRSRSRSFARFAVVEILCRARRFQPIVVRSARMRFRSRICVPPWIWICVGMLFGSSLTSRLLVLARAAGRFWRFWGQVSTFDIW